MTRSILLLTLLALAACAAEDRTVRVETAGTHPAALDDEPTPKLDAFTEELSGTTVTFEMLPVPGGTVTVETADGPKEVEVAPFYMGKTEVTWDEYDVFVYGLDEDDSGEFDAESRPSRPYVPPDLGYGHNGYATISVAALGAECYCKWLTYKTGKTYRLATEAEWQLACELGGISADAIDAHGWHKGNADNTPHEVGSKDADALGFHDLYGNVREWVHKLDGTAVAIGGSFMDEAGEVGCAARHEYTRMWQDTDPQVPKSKWWLSDAPFMGFRVVCEAGP